MSGLEAHLNTILIVGIPLILAITLHEAAHGYVALRYGDDTALRMGRVTLNPISHIDLYGTIIIPGLLLLSGTGFLFGYAKPVPVNFARLNNPKRDMMLVAAAGPATNIALALASAVLLKLATLFIDPSMMSNIEKMVLESLVFSIGINVLLAVFNMLPLPPLDGGRVMVGLLPPKPAYSLARVEPYGMFILLGLIFLVPIITGALGQRISPFATLLLPIVDTLKEFIMKLVGF